MAQQTSMTLDGTLLEYFYAAISPSPGDTYPAIWRCESFSLIPGHRPIIKTLCRDNGTKNGRRVEMQFTYPVLATDANTALETIVAKVPLTISALVPSNVSDVQVADAMKIAASAFSDPLMQSIFVSGFNAS